MKVSSAFTVSKLQYIVLLRFPDAPRPYRMDGLREGLVDISRLHETPKGVASEIGLTNLRNGTLST